jgi:hypothetical protein
MRGDQDHGGECTAPASRVAPVPRPTAPRAAPPQPEAGATDPLLLLAPTVLCAASWAAGDATLADFGFATLAALCVMFVLRDLARLDRPRVGRIIFYSGTLAWFCHDYLTNWFDIDYRLEAHPPELIARVATMHALFVTTVAVGMRAPFSARRVEGLVRRIPEPRSAAAYMWIIVVIFALGLAPYAFLTRDGLFTAVYQEMTGFYARGAQFEFRRTGNLNYDWSGYIFELIKLGRLGGILAAFYAINVARGLGPRALGWGIWAFWTLIAFGSGTRGELVFMAMPVLVLLLMRRRTTAERLARTFQRQRPSLKVAILALVVLGMIQVQGQLRGVGLSEESVSSVELDRVSGNRMFTEGLEGWAWIPSRIEPFYDRTPGEGALRAIPDLAFRIVIHPIPRALWTSKPVDPVWAWYNQLVVGTEGSAGTTVSSGLVGWWYFRFGFLGMLEGALVMGAVYAFSDQALRFCLARQRTFAALVVLGILAWMFRCFRDIAIGELYTLLIGVFAIAASLKVVGAR